MSFHACFGLNIIEWIISTIVLNPDDFLSNLIASLTSRLASRHLAFVITNIYIVHLHKLYCFPSVAADAITQVFPSQTKSNLLSRKNMFDVVTESGLTTKQHNPSTQSHATLLFRFLFRSHRAAR